MTRQSRLVKSHLSHSVSERRPNRGRFGTGLIEDPPGRVQARARFGPYGRPSFPTGVCVVPLHAGTLGSLDLHQPGYGHSVARDLDVFARLDAGEQP